MPHHKKKEPISKTFCKECNEWHIEQSKKCQPSDNHFSVHGWGELTEKEEVNPDYNK